MLLEEHLEATHRYDAARDRQRRLLEEGLQLDTHGQVAWEREQLHER